MIKERKECHFILGVHLGSRVPHDKVKREKDSEWKQVMLKSPSSPSLPFEEVLFPLLDNSIRETALLCLNEEGYLTRQGAGLMKKSLFREVISPSSSLSLLRKHSHAAFIPTSMFTFIQALNINIPKNRFHFFFFFQMKYIYLQ